ncbi:MAG: hypothetical protein JO256_11945, partial [Alphaproteobacteria bacterium]|nr:hypothetical protein [Alphaproteobacteria bacterium]
MRLTPLIALTMLLAGCAHRPEMFNADVTAADQTCKNRQFASAMEKMDCLTLAELPVVQKDIPFASYSFNEFAKKRYAAAKLLDAETANAAIAYKEFVERLLMYNAHLTAEAPSSADPKSQLSRDVLSLNVASVCGDNLRLVLEGAQKWATCTNALIRPAWERDSNDTVRYWDEYFQSVLPVAEHYDATGSPATNSAAMKKYNDSMNAAVKDFYDSAQSDLQAQIAKEQADAAQRQAQMTASLNALSNFVGNLAALTLAGAVA